MISEVRSGVEQNLAATLKGSFGLRSTATDHWRSGPSRPAIMAPSVAATNTACPSYELLATESFPRSSLKMMQRRNARLRVQDIVFFFARGQIVLPTKKHGGPS